MALHSRPVVAKCPNCGRPGSLPVKDVKKLPKANTVLRTHRCPNPKCQRVVLTEERIIDGNRRSAKLR